MDISPVKLFTEKGLEPILLEIKKKVDEFEPNIETVGGRKEIASFAHKIAQSKVFIDKAGKELVAKQKAEIKLIDTERKRSRDFLDEQKDRARLPLTEWEEAEKAREEAERIEQEFNDDFESALAEDSLFNREREIRLKEEAEAKKEAERREKEEAERLEKERVEREERMKKEAAEQAKREAEEKVRKAEEAAKQAERDRIAAEERAKVEKEEAAKRAEREKQEAIDRAKAEAEAEAKRVEEERLRKEAAEKAEAERKAAHHAHRKRINREALTDLEILGFDTDNAKAFIKAVAEGSVSHITINY